MLAETTSFTLEAITARMVRVEVDVQRGLPAFQIVGLPDAAVREARERVRASLVNCGFEFPLRRITANLAPADLRKVGPGLDLALAAALLGAAGEIPVDRIRGMAFAGELALDGSVRPVRGALAMAEAARSRGMAAIVLPPANGPEAALAAGIEVRCIGSVSELRDIAGEDEFGERPAAIDLAVSDEGPDMADLRGQPHLRSSLEVAAAGGHSVLMIGPPGSGKSLAARRLPSILPPLSGGEVLEVARIAGACGAPGFRIVSKRPFRAPHHTVSAAGLVGGGNPLRPGEITLAHRGVLFLDELCEFRRDALEALREPLESGEVALSRANSRQVLPARIALVAAANPCPCGRGEDDPACECATTAIRRYRALLSGALADRIDMIVAVAQPSAESMAGAPGETSKEVRRRVLNAREAMYDRFGEGRTNASATAAEVAAFDIDEAAAGLLSVAYRRYRMSGRAHDRVLRLARTVADLESQGPVSESHLARALQLRRRGES